MSSTLRRMCGPMCMVFILALCLALTACGSISAQSAGITLDVNDVPLYQVVLLLTQQSGINIIVDQEKAQRRITAHLSGLPLEKVLDYVMTSAGVDYYKKDDGTYIVGGDRPARRTPEPYIEVQSEPTAPLIAEEPARPRTVRTEVVRLVHTSPSDILSVLGLDSGSVRNTPLTTAPGANMEEQYPWKPTTMTQPRTHAPAGGLFGSDGIVPPVTDNADIRPPGAGRTATDEFGAGQRPPTGYTGATRPGTIPTQAPGAPTRPGTTPGAMPTPGAPGATATTGLMPEGIDLIMAYDIDNSIIIRGDDIGIAEFKDLLHLVDIPPKQVEIKAEFIEVSTTAIRNFGIDWSLERLNFSFDTQFSPTGDVLVGFAFGNVRADVLAQLRDIGARVVNAPIVSTLNNTPATIEIGKSIPFFQGVVQRDQVGTITTTQLIEIPVTTYLFVLPRVNGDGSITMFIEPSLQDTGAIYTAPDGGVFPETTYQRIRTNRRVMNGETVVVGGLIRKADRHEERRVPILSDIPIIGGLFRTKSSTLEDRELLIFLTPRIIPERSGGTIGVTP